MKKLITMRDRFQVRAFEAFYRAALIGGGDSLMAFVSAIVKSCDDEVSRLPAGSIERWQRMYKTKRGIKNEPRMDTNKHEG